MNIYFITGTSRGIGRACVTHLLAKPENRVIGIGRSTDIEHPHYRFAQADLANAQDLKGIVFDAPIEAKQVMLINNAAMLGEVGVLGTLSDDEIDRTIAVNLTAPIVLMNRFVKTFNRFEGRKIIVNVSSGAAKHAIDSWASYCASKAGLEMATQVLAAEERVKRHRVHAYAFAPGVFDTAMQAEVRSVDEAIFSQVARFKSYYEEGRLQDPLVVVQRLFSQIEGELPGEVFLS